MHGMNPEVRVEFLKAVSRRVDRFLRSEDADISTEVAHLLAQVFSHDGVAGRLVA